MEKNVGFNHTYEIISNLKRYPLLHGGAFIKLVILQYIILNKSLNAYLLNIY